MRSIVVPIATVRDTAWAVGRILEEYRSEPVDVHLLNVRRPLPRHVSQFFKKSGGLDDVYQQSGMEVLQPAIRALDAAGIPHRDHVRVGQMAKTIVAFAKQHQCEVVLDSKTDGGLSVFGLGSIATQVQRLMHANNGSTRPSNAT